MLKLNYFVSINQLTTRDCFELFKLATLIKNKPSIYQNTLKGKLIATIFYEPSTRTRLSFESAIYRLGGQVLTVENAQLSSSHSKGESLKDTLKVVEGYTDAIIMRHPLKDSLKNLISFIKKPLINAGDGQGEHPTQALLDAFTLYEHYPKLSGLNILIAGDLKNGRTAHSLVGLMNLFENNHFYFLSPKSLEFPKEYLKGRINFTFIEDFEQLSHKMDVLYMTRLQKERLLAHQKNLDYPYHINQTQLNSILKDQGILLHPLPRVDEISESIDEDPRALYFEQAHNGVWLRMALLSSLNW